MYAIISEGKVVGRTENPHYIKYGKNGDYLVRAEKEHAIGVAINGIAYNLDNNKEIPDAPSAIIRQVDPGEVLFFEERRIDDILKQLDEYRNRLAAVESDGWTKVVRRSAEYVMGDIAYARELPSWLRLECILAGTTAEKIDWVKILEDFESRGISPVGQVVEDGAVIWTIDDIRDATPVGTIRPCLFVPPGYTLANGATVQREDYPRLVDWVDKNDLWRDTSVSTINDIGKFGKGDGQNTFVLPDCRDRWVSLKEGNPGLAIAAGVPNITGYVGSEQQYGINVFYFDKSWLRAPGNGTRGCYNSDDATWNNIGFDASRCSAVYGGSDTVQPPSINYKPCIKY